MTAREGPPDDAAREASPTCPGTSVKGLTKTHNRHPQGITAPRRIGRYGRTRRGADLWREGYCYGFLAALRDVARAVDDPNVWVALDRVGENFTLPADDDYRLAGGDD